MRTEPVESRALCRFYIPFRCPGFCLCPLLSSLLPQAFASAHCYLHSFRRNAGFPRFGNSFRRSFTYAVLPIPATRRISTFPLPDGLPLLPKEYRFPAFQRLLPKEYDIITKESYTPLQCNPQTSFHLMNRHIPIFKQLPRDFQLFRCR